VTTYDNEKSPKPIERSKSSFLDATNYKATKIPAEVMKIQPSNLEIGTASQWTIFLTVPIPMELGCYIKMYYPTDLEFEFKRMIAQGFFAPKTGDRLYEEQINSQVDEKRGPYIAFEGCNDYNGVGYEPYGRLVINTLRTPSQIKDSGQFSIEIFKSKSLSKRIAY